MPTRQFEHFQEMSMKRLQEMVPHECPLVVRRGVAVNKRGQFIVDDIDHGERYSGRFEVVAAWIKGYMAAWSWQK